MVVVVSCSVMLWVVMVDDGKVIYQDSQVFPELKDVRCDLISAFCGDLMEQLVLDSLTLVLEIDLHIHG
jgi:hypothetical protein